MDETPEIPNIESPRIVYSRLLDQNRQKLANQKKWDSYLGYAKLALGLLAVVFAIRFLQTLHGIVIVLLPVVIFIVLAIVHERVLARIREINAVIIHYDRGLARLEDRWAGKGEGGERFMDPAHPYARDLDIFGAGSIFELLCTFRTRAGEETLARWLLQPASPDEIRARQSAAQELRTRTEFREKLFTAGDKVRLGLHPHSLAAWGEEKPWVASRWWSVLAAILAVLWGASIFYGLLRHNYWPLLGLSAINWFVNRHLVKRLSTSAEAIEAATDDLDLLADVLLVLEKEQFASPKLAQLQSALKTGGIAPSAAVKKLDRIVHYLEQRRNKLIGWFDSYIFYSAQFMFRAEYWRKEFGPAIRGWLAAVGEMEVLAALSGYAFEHPGDVWPEIDDDSPGLEAESFAHPLQPENKVVRNDLKLGSGLQLIILSGPNMSGKSTLIRGIGVNVVLAQCGAPVRAKRLRLSRLAVGASICILDSLQGGVSRFYAEIRRLKLISDLAQGPIPVLFLLDELLSGTNSHDRLLGTEMVVKSLVQRGAMGMVSTHDLALAHIPEDMNELARNYHFEDHLENGNLAFDFKLKTGVVQTSNALKLMQSIGLLSE
jgi:MutS domain V